MAVWPSGVFGGWIGWASDRAFGFDLASFLDLNLARAFKFIIVFLNLV